MLFSFLDKHTLIKTWETRFEFKILWLYGVLWQNMAMRGELASDLQSNLQSWPLSSPLGLFICLEYMYTWTSHLAFLSYLGIRSMSRRGMSSGWAYPLGTMDSHPVGRDTARCQSRVLWSVDLGKGLLYVSRQNSPVSFLFRGFKLKAMNKLKKIH